MSGSGETSAETRVGTSRPVSRKDAAYAALKSKILTNQLHPGALIDDSHEADLLGMSKTPVREALLLLEAEGFVEVMPRRGIRVVPITLRDMREIYQILSALEITAVELIALRRPDAELVQDLTDACQAMRAALEAGDSIAWNAGDEAFHVGLLSLSDNLTLAQTGVKFRQRVQRGHLFAIRHSSPFDLEQSIRHHEETVALLLSDDPRRAVQLHTTQRSEAGGRLIALLERSGITMF